MLELRVGAMATHATVLTSMASRLVVETGAAVLNSISNVFRAFRSMNRIFIHSLIPSVEIDLALN
jgi:hypothetical protein